jgi:hypothetical protein
VTNPRVLQWTVVCASFALAFLACTAPAILGGPTPATTTHPCATGGTCPTGYDCPPYDNPTGPCEANLWSGARAPADAGGSDGDR